MLTAIQLRNFKCFESLKLSLMPLTLLCGLNGMGKSSILQALLLLRQSKQTGELAKGGLTLEGDLVDLGTGHDVRHENAKKDVIEFSLWWKGIASPWTLAFDYLRDRDQLKARDLQVASEDMSTQWNSVPPFGGRVLYVNAERIGPRKFHQHSETRASRADSVTRGEFALSCFYAIQSEAMPKDDPRCEGLTTHRLRGIVRYWLNEIVPGTQLELEEITGADAITAGFSFQREGAIETRQYHSTNISFGLSSVLPVLIGLLAPRGSLCLIENPEAHLHPRGQTRLAELAVRAVLAGVQVIVETHSDHFLDGVRIAIRDEVIVSDKIAIHYFKRTGTCVEAASPVVDANGRLSFWPEGFFDQHEENLARLLAPRKRDTNTRETILNPASRRLAGPNRD